MKVYCKNCQWKDLGIGLCLPKFEKDISSKIANKYGISIISWDDRHYSPKSKITIELPSRTINAKNDCPFYQRQWWKFWVKP